MFIHQDINYEMLETKAKDIECIRIKIPNMNMTIINVYKPPKLSIVHSIIPCKNHRQ